MKNKTGLMGVLFIVIGLIFFIVSCATTPPPEEKKAAPAKKEEAVKPAQPAAPAKPKLTPDDVTLKDGLLIRKNPPAFTLDYPTSMEPRPLTGTQIYSGGQSEEPFSLQVAIDDLGDSSFEDWVKGAGEGWVAALKKIGGFGAKIIRSEPIDDYGKFKAVEMEIEWTWTDGSTQLVNLNHYILKGDKVITLSGTVMGDIDSLALIYETIDLNP